MYLFEAIRNQRQPPWPWLAVTVSTSSEPLRDKCPLNFFTRNIACEVTMTITVYILTIGLKRIQ